MSLANPFCPVAQEKESLFFVAESERAKEFVKYVVDSIDGNANFTSIVGDYGQGKSRMLFYLLNRYKDRPDALMAFVSIKHVVGNISGSKWEESLFREILNQVINDLRVRYQDSRPDVTAAIDRIKQELVPKREIETLLKAIDEKDKNGDKDGAEDLKKILGRVLQKESLEPDAFFQYFLPKLTEDLKKKGIDKLFILFDELDHLYGSEKRHAYLSFVAKFRDPIEGVSIVLSCASRIWLQIRTDFSEFTQVYDPATPLLNFIPRYTYADLRNIVRMTLKSVNQERYDPIDDWILRTITRYYSNLRDMIKIIQELYQEYIKNPNGDLRKLFGEKARSMLDTPRISKIAEDTSRYLTKNTTRKPTEFKNGIEDVLISLAINPLFYECGEEELKGLLGGSLGTAVIAEKAFDTLLGDGYLIRTPDGKLQLNTDRFSRQIYIGQWEQAFLDRLWDIKDPKTSEVKIDEARKSFDELSSEMGIPSDYFDNLVETLIEREKIAKREDTFLLKFQKQETLAGSIENTVKTVKKEAGKIESRETYSTICRTLLENVAQQEQLRKIPSGFDKILVSFARARSFRIQGNVLFWLPARTMDVGDLKKELVEKLSNNDFVYVLWPYEDYTAVLPLVARDALSSGQIVEDTKVNEIQIPTTVLDTGLSSRARILVVHMKHRISTTVWKFALEDYLLAREAILRDVKESSKAVDEIDQLIRNGFTNPNLLQTPDLILTEKLERLIPIDNKNLKNLDVEKWTNVLTKLFRGQKPDVADLDQKDARMVGVYNFLSDTDQRAFPTGLAFDSNKTAVYKGHKLPKFVIHIMEDLPSDRFVDAREVALGSLKYGQGYEIVPSELGKRAGTYVPAMIPVLDALCNALPDVIVRDASSTPDLPRYKKSGGEYSRLSLQRDLDFTIPLLERLIRHKAIEGRESPSLEKDIESVKSNLIPELLDLLEKKKSTVQVLERVEYCHLRKEKIANADRIKVIESQANVQHNLLLKEMENMPSLQECSPQYLTMANVHDEIDSAISTGVKSGIALISEKDARHFVDSLLESHPKHMLLGERYESLNRTILTCKEDFSKIKYLGQISSSLDEKALLNLLDKSKDLKLDLSCIHNIKQARGAIQNEVDGIGDIWIELVIDSISEIETTQKRMSDWVQICRSNGIQVETPPLDPSKIRPLKDESVRLKQQGSLLLIGSALSSLVSKTLLKYAVERDQEEKLLNAIRGSFLKFLSEKCISAIQELKPYDQFAKKHGIGDLKISASKARIDMLASEKEAMMKRNKFVGLKDSIDVDLKEVVETETRNLRKELLRKLPEDLRTSVQEAIKAIDENRIIKHIDEMYREANDSFDKRMKILVELEEVGLIGRRQ